MPDTAGQRRVDDQVIAERLEAEHRPQQEHRRPGRPGLWAASGRVLNRILRHFARIAAERLRQAAGEIICCVEHPRSNLSRLVLEAVTS